MPDNNIVSPCAGKNPGEIREAESKVRRRILGFRIQAAGRPRKPLWKFGISGAGGNVPAAGVKNKDFQLFYAAKTRHWPNSVL